MHPKMTMRLLLLHFLMTLALVRPALGEEETGHAPSPSFYNGQYGGYGGGPFGGGGYGGYGAGGPFGGGGYGGGPFGGGGFGGGFGGGPFGGGGFGGFGGGGGGQGSSSGNGESRKKAEEVGKKADEVTKQFQEQTQKDAQAAKEQQQNFAQTVTGLQPKEEKNPFFDQLSEQIKQRAEKSDAVANDAYTKSLVKMSESNKKLEELDRQEFSLALQSIQARTVSNPAATPPQTVGERLQQALGLVRPLELAARTQNPSDRVPAMVGGAGTNFGPATLEPSSGSGLTLGSHSTGLHGAR